MRNIERDASRRIFVATILVASWTLTDCCYVFPADVPDPCRQRSCPAGARCVPSADGLTSKCECPDKCPRYGDHNAAGPVCGTDLREYRDACELRRAACAQGKDIRVKFDGPCDPCTSVTCPAPEVCTLGPGRVAKCRCGEVCPIDFSPVCGSDGQTYASQCALRHEECRTGRTLLVFHRGRCKADENPCKSIRCGIGQQCHVGRDGIARCECPPPCQDIVRPVCGSDGITYQSECALRRAACESQQETQIAYAGLCGAEGPCARHSCAHGASCVERGGIAHCECPTCSSHYEPICGSDGISYGNECQLRLEGCRHRRTIQVLHAGLCNGCEGNICGPQARCELDSEGKPHCTCPDCKEEQLSSGTVCGTDGTTYKNRCELLTQSCRNSRSVSVDYEGECDPCRKVTCRAGATCVSGNCECAAHCDGISGGLAPEIPGAAAVREAVCGSNRVTYRNECELRRAECERPLSSPPIDVLFYGDCRERFGLDVAPNSNGGLQKNLSPSRINDIMGVNKTIPPGAIAVGIGLDSFSSPSPPAVPVDACRDIRCDYDATCEVGVDAYPRCVCRFNCSAGGDAVCASDRKLYSNVCEMKKEGCQRQEELRLRPLELCKGMEVKPCGGSVTPLRESTTGLELDCGAGQRRQDCPRGSYCHQTPHFARCCPKPSLAPASNISSSSGTSRNNPESPSNVPPSSVHTSSGSATGSPAAESCSESWFGCCADGKTAAKSSDGAGCPMQCDCNRLGSLPGADGCDALGRCVCKEGVGGEKCDRCQAGYWGLQKFAGTARGNKMGCVPCECHPLGAVRDDCEQMTGRCVCRPGVNGSRCNNCVVSGHVMSSSGCVPPGTVTERPLKRSTLDRSTESGGTGAGVSYKSTRHLDQSEPPPAPHPAVPPRLKDHEGLTGHGQDRYFYAASGNRSDSEVDVHSLTTNEVFGAGLTNELQPAAVPTPAAPIGSSVGTPSFIGDWCASNLDCRVLHSVCRRGTCVCIDGDSETSRTWCPPPLPSTPSTDSGLCAPGGEGCVDFVNETEQGMLFTGSNWLQLSRLEASHALVVEIEFRTFSPEGILVYAQQQGDGSGDFVSLALVNGHVEFRYNLGSGAVILRSTHRLALHQPHRVSAKRYHRDGVLTVDGAADLTGQSQGSLHALDLEPRAWVGGVPANHSRVMENIGIAAGFTGCIKRLILGQRRITTSEASAYSGVGRCGADPCSLAPCRNGGSCIPLNVGAFRCACASNYTGTLCDTPLDPCLAAPCAAGSTCEPLIGGGFHCRCVPGRHGKTCQLAEEAASPVIATFNGTQFLQLPRLESVGRAFSLEVWFMSLEPDGLLLYNGQRPGSGDFIVLGLRDGRVHFSFDLGSGPARIVSEESIRLGTWHAVRVSRTDRSGTLQLDNGTVARGQSSPPLNELNLDLPLYVGSLPAADANPEASIVAGFVGFIQRLVVNGQTVTALWAAAEAANLSTYQSFPCFLDDGRPACIHPDAVCVPRLNIATCRCPSGVYGSRCEHRDAPANTSVLLAPPVKFAGDTFLHSRGPNQGRPSFLRNETEVTIAVNGTMEDDESSGDDEEEWEEWEDAQEEDDLAAGPTMATVAIEDMSDVNGDITDTDDIDDYPGWRRGRRVSRLSLQIRTSADTGLLVWAGRGRTLNADYLTLAIVNGFVQLSFNLGSQRGFLVIQSKVAVNDDRWHTVHVIRRKRMGLLRVDHEPAVRGYSDPRATLLNSGDSLWIGGCPTLPSGLPAAYYQGFQGCMRSVVSNRVSIDLTRLQPHQSQEPLLLCGSGSENEKDYEIV